MGATTLEIPCICGICAGAPAHQRAKLVAHRGPFDDNPVTIVITPTNTITLTRDNRLALSKFLNGATETTPA